MSWFSGANPLDELVEKATDSTLPSDSEDLALNLEICDRIRSKAVTAKDAMRSLKKRISHKNPNVQLLALNLCDLCVKNGGSHFLVEIASREFVDNLVSLLRQPLGINFEVRQRMLALVQAWALAFETRPELGYMMSTYQSLRTEGLQFPPEERVAAAFVDTAAPPDWADSDVCMRCRTAFTFRNRKHHCRNCGNVFCGQCSAQTMTLPQLGITEPVRVCDGCHAKRAQSTGGMKPPPQRLVTVPSYQQTPVAPPSRSQAEPEDLDLKRALELSLKESKKYEAPRAVQKEPTPAPIPVEEEDADLKAAIEASLRESAAATQQKEAYHYPTLSPATAGNSAAIDQATRDANSGNTQLQHKPANPHELQPAEQENIKLFATLVDRLKSDSNGAILRDPKIQELYESISQLRPKLARSLGDSVGKYESLVETHSKLATVVKYYDRMLEARLASTYGRGQYTGHDQWGPSDPYSNTSPQTYGQTHAGGYNYSGQAQTEESDYYRNGSNHYVSSGPPQYHEHNSLTNRNQAQTYPPGNDAPGGTSSREPEQPKEEVSLIDL